MKTLNRQVAGPEYESFQIVLQSLWNYFEAIRLNRTERNFEEVLNLLESAADGFGQVKQKELRDLSIGMNLYVKATIELLNKNIGQSLIFLNDTKKHLRSAGKFGHKFEPLVLLIESDAYFIQGVNALLALDYDNAKTNIDSASQTLKLAAHKYHQKGGRTYNSLIGKSYLYEAVFIFVQANNEFNQFKYDRLAAEQNLAREAIKAHKFLKKGDTEDITLRDFIYLSKALTLLLEVTNELSKLMQNIFHSTFKPDIQALMVFRKKIRKATNLISKGSPNIVVYIKMCNQLSEQINNLERLAKPNKKDFGAFSGIVACALFLPLFLIISWANFALKIGLNPWTMIFSSLVLGLIGGFGYGAIKFKSLISLGLAKG